MSFFELIPEVKPPVRKLGFREKLKWTVVVLVLYFLLAQIPMYGLDPQWETDYFEAVRAIIAGKFGSIITLGIGPIVTAGIILQLLVGVELIPIDMQTPEGRKTFQGLSELMTFAVAIFEAVVYVFMGGLPPASPTLFMKLVLVSQLFAGTILIMFLDQISEKWGFMSGISLFIASGVASQIFIAAFNPFPSPTNPSVSAGRIPAAIQFFSSGEPSSALATLMPLFFTVVVFFVAVYAQSIKVEIPLSFGRVRGFSTRWPLSLFYTSNMPVILVAALVANIQLWARLLYTNGVNLFGTFNSEGAAVSGLVYYMQPPNDLIYRMLLSPGTFFGGLFSDLNQVVFAITSPAIPLNVHNLIYLDMLIRAFSYTIFMMAGAVLFAEFWVKTSNMDAKSVAKQISQSGMHIRGFRSDPRVLEIVLQRYIPYLTFLGALAVGALAAFADFTNAIGGGTGMLLTVMIVYRLYQVVTREHLVDMHPMLRHVMGGQ